ncbi:MAG TPA: hypothetical protein VEG27_11825 [Usitatibacter sp.]|nr:hypothetical protein [Usitatibacter sp.]
MKCTAKPLAKSARQVFIALLSSAFVATTAHAQTDSERIRDLERKLDESMQLIRKLNARVGELEKERAPAPAAAKPATAAQEARIEKLERDVTQIASSRSSAVEVGGIPLHGFTDVDYQSSGRPTESGRTSGFTLGNLDFYLTPSFGRVRMLGELNFEVNSEGGLDTDLERLQLGYAVSDALTAWMGRFHTPYGYWNAAFHHGAQIQTSITRPRFIDFEDKGGVLPAHTVGLWATGHVPAGDGQVVYDAYFANGSRIVDGTLDFNAFLDDNANKAVGANVGYRFGGALDGLLLGLHGLREDVNAYDGGTLAARTRLALAGGYFYLDRDDWEGIGEYYRFHNRDLSEGGTTHTSWAAFLQLGKTFAERWTPYYRWEEAALDATDPYFAMQVYGNSYRRHVGGLRFALNPNTALKVEANRTRETFGAEDKSYTEIRAQFAVRF